MDRIHLIAALALLSCGSTPSSDTDASSTDTSTSSAPTTTATTSNTTATTSVDTGADSGGESTGVDEGTTGDPPPPADAVAVAVGYGTRRVRSADGLTWTDFVEVDPNGGDDDTLLRGVGYGEGMFVAEGGSAAALTMRSPDGIAWESVSNDLGSFVSDVAWQDGIFVAAGGNGLRARSLDGGGSWQDATPYYSGHFRAIAAGNGVFVAVGHTYGDTNVGLTSTSEDGASWTTEQTLGAPLGGQSIAFGSGVFVARDGGGALWSSADGEAWGEPVGQRAGEGPVIRANDAFLTSGADGFWTSPDGQTWEQVGAGDGRPVHGWQDGHYLSLGWPASIAVSDDLQRWSNTISVDGPGLTDVAVGSPGPGP